jgi:hypothetical protein
MFENHGVDQVDILSPGQRLPVEIFPGIIAGKMLVNVTAEVTLGGHINPLLESHFLPGRAVMADRHIQLNRLVLETARYIQTMTSGWEFQDRLAPTQVRRKHRSLLRGNHGLEVVTRQQGGHGIAMMIPRRTRKRSPG